MDDAIESYGLMKDEIELYKKFCQKHTACGPEKASAMMEEDCAPVYSTILLPMSTIGMAPVAQCGVCGAVESIACKKRLDKL